MADWIAFSKSIQNDRPLILQGDHTALVEVNSPLCAQAHDALASFAELVKSQEHVHTYRITPLSIWNARAARVSADEIIYTLQELSKYDVLTHVETYIAEWAGKRESLVLPADVTLAAGGPFVTCPGPLPWTTVWSCCRR